MPILLDRTSPESLLLQGERVIFTDRQRAAQNLRVAEIAICNLLPSENETETQLMRLLSNSPLPVNMTLIRIPSLGATTAKKDALEGFCQTFDEARDKKFDGLIVTGVSVENTPFEKTANWKELKEILKWTRAHANSTLFIGWGAQAALYCFYGIKKHPLKEKCFGIFAHQRVRDGSPEPLMRGISDEFPMPHSRHTLIYAKDILHVNELKILAYSKKAGASVIKSVDNRQVFVTGHIEYDRYSLKYEYERDLEKGLNCKPPVNYFVDKEGKEIKMNWTSTANLFTINWLNYYVYQASPEVIG